MQVKPLSAVLPGAAARATPSRQSHRMDLIAALTNGPPKSSSSLRPDPLLSLLSDTETLSRFIRYAGLSEGMGAALLLDVANSTLQARHLSARSMGEVDELLAKIKPTTARIGAAYGAIAGLGEAGAKPAKSRTDTGELRSGFGRDPALFAAFSPTQVDFKYTIDDLEIRRATGEFHEPHIPAGWYTPVEPALEKIQGISGVAYVVLMCLTGIVAFGFFVAFH
jgi:hypothetical protein